MMIDHRGIVVSEFAFDGYLRIILYAAIASFLLLAALFYWNRALRRGIQQRTTELAESELRFRQIAAATREVVWMSKLAIDDLVYVSPAYEAVWGRSLASLRSNPRSFIDAIHPDDREAAVNAFENGKESGFEVTYRVVRPDGSIRWVRDRGFPVRDAAGNVCRVAGTAEDISDSRRVLDALRRSELDLAEAQRVARLGSWSFDLDSGSVRWSDELYRVFELEKDGSGLDYARFLATVSPEDKEHVVQTSIDARTHGRPFEIVYRIALPEGRHKTIREVGYARRSADGRVCGLFGTAQDVTEYKRTEQALRDTSQQLQALSRRLVDLQEAERAAIARELHDRVGQNLTALNINMSILSGSLPTHSTTEVRARLADSEALIESTAAAIRSLLSELRPPMLDDQGLCAALEWHARAVAKRSGIRVSIEEMDGSDRLPPEVEIAFFRIAQEALNNVVKHAAADNVRIRLRRSEAEYVMQVQDDGVGIDATADDATASPGLGIVTMRERAQSVGGVFDVGEVAGGGTLLTVRVKA